MGGHHDPPGGVLRRPRSRRSGDLVRSVCVGTVTALVVWCGYGCATEDDSWAFGSRLDASVAEVSKDAGHQAESGGCVAATCISLGAQCGSAPDGCGSAIECGACPDGQICGGNGPNLCGATACSPKTCAEAGASCGVTSDGCSATLNCGTCQGQSCVQNQCACVPTTCVAQAAQCGSVADGCGGILECGTCPAGQTCGSAGANKCGTGTCQPTTCAAQGAACGVIADGCNGTLTCPSCPPDKTCNSQNQCVCAPTFCSAYPGQCGVLSDGCGGTLTCSCTVPAVCTSGACCTKTTCAAAGAECGSVPDGCAGNLDCGGCAGGSICNASNHCQGADCNGKLCGSADGIGGQCGPGSGCCGGMVGGQLLPKDKGIFSCNGLAYLAHQSDGNLVVYHNPSGTPLWNSGTAGKDTAALAMQGDGNCVLYGPSYQVYWNSGTEGHPGAFLAIQDDCNFVLYDGGTAIWNTAKTCP